MESGLQMKRNQQRMEITMSHYLKTQGCLDHLRILEKRENDSLKSTRF